MMLICFYETATNYFYMNASLFLFLAVLPLLLAPETLLRRGYIP